MKNQELKDERIRRVINLVLESVGSVSIEKLESLSNGDFNRLFEFFLSRDEEKLQILFSSKERFHYKDYYHNYAPSLPEYDLYHLMESIKYGFDFSGAYVYVGGHGTSIDKLNHLWNERIVTRFFYWLTEEKKLFDSWLGIKTNLRESIKKGKAWPEELKATMLEKYEDKKEKIELVEYHNGFDPKGLLNNEVRIFLREFSILEIRNFSEKKYCILSEQAFEEIFTEAQRIVVKILLQEKDFKKFFDNLKIEAHLNYNNIGGGGCNHC